MRQGPQRYPGASTAYWYGSKYPGSAMEVNVVVWHSTEGRSLPDYAGGSMAPNLTAVPDFAAKRIVWYQHFDFDVSSRALRNLSGGVETNTLNVCQVEVVGTCDPATHEKWRAAGYPHLFMPDLPDWVVRDLGAFARWAQDNHGVPLSSDVTWKAYPGSYGVNGVRMTGAQWNAFKGHCGHQHVPENDHGDPGMFPMAAILTAAKGGATEEDPLAAFTPQQVHDAVWKIDDIAAPADAPDAATNETWQPQSYLKDTNARLRALAKKVDTLSDVQVTDQQIAALASAVAANPALAEQIAEKVAAKLAARLAQ